MTCRVGHKKWIPDGLGRQDAQNQNSCSDKVQHKHRKKTSKEFHVLPP